MSNLEDAILNYIYLFIASCLIAATLITFNVKIEDGYIFRIFLLSFTVGILSYFGKNKKDNNE